MKTRKEILAEIYGDISSISTLIEEAPIVNELTNDDKQREKVLLFNLRDHELGFTLVRYPLANLVAIAMQSTDSDKISLHCSDFEHC